MNTDIDPQQTDARYERPSFEDALRQLINRYSMENGSNTPDYLLAEYLVACLNAYGLAVTKRDRWFGFEPWSHVRPYQRGVTCTCNEEDPTKCRCKVEASTCYCICHKENRP